MKKLVSIAFCLILTLSVLVGCSQKSAESTPDEVTTATIPATIDETSVPTEPPTEPETIFIDTENFDVSSCADEYLRVMELYENSTLTLTGLPFAHLVDFDKNGIPELILGHGPENPDEFGQLYSIYAMVNGEAVRVDTGDIFTVGGPDPYIKLAYTEDEVYFITGKSQACFRTNYRRFTGNCFETIFSYSNGNGDGEFFINDEIVPTEYFHSAINEFESTFTNTEDISLIRVSLTAVDNVKAVLNNY